ncbi:HHHH-motif protein [Phenylobacterium sp.]|jgi:hypothetical protein|nr:HHHH-motif protein [Phenylobacterium sp.]
MKTFLAIAIAAGTLVAFASSADARPHHHRVCYMRHHHRVCHWG